ncbi:ras gtpase-activating protein [Anaeramoeba ignava]|uniref:Ras gtpase-activating protein n=1 Tax=Anaeramoeba ignava TaxID=1746090 RepID=A0A9Q0RB12_ANAIG|nr:ras gtpase-activating protein [Anaeramoeba ignava]|eukprot:Anaeramoba_ignava/a349116_548.p1 GENE.a349116_548~~a349116_548.p1  ORF type:complete len:1080 (+),score=216.83 a349116_548:71-3310(+)
MNFLNFLPLFLFLFSFSLNSRTTGINYFYTYQQHNPLFVDVQFSNGSIDSIDLGNTNSWYFISDSTTHTGVDCTTRLSDTIPVNFFLDSPEYTTEMWFSNLSAGSNYILMNMVDTYSNKPLIMALSNTELKIVCSSGSATITIDGLNGSTPLHLLIVWTSVNQDIYVNGVYNTSTSLNCGTQTAMIDPLQEIHKVYFMGVYNKALNPTEIGNNFEVGLPSWYDSSNDTIQLNDSMTYEVNFLDYLTLNNLTFNNMEILGVDTDTPGSNCTLYQINPPEKMINFPFTLANSISSIEIQTPVKPSGPVMCNISYRMNFTDNNFGSVFQSNISVNVNVSITTIGPWFETYITSQMSTVASAVLTMEYVDDLGQTVTNFTVTGLSSGTLYYNNVTISNGVPVTIVSPAQNGTLELGYKMSTSNNGNTTSIETFNFELNSTSGLSNQDTVDIALNNTNLYMNKTTNNLTEDNSTNVDFSFFDSVAGTVSSSWSAYWSGPCDGSTIMVGQNTVSCPGVLTSQTSVMEDSNPLTVSIKPPQYKNGLMNLTFSLTNGLISRTGINLEFYIEPVFNQATISATCSNNCKTQGNMLLYTATNFTIDFTIFDPDEYNLKLDLSLLNFEMEAANVSGQIGQIMGSKSQIMTQLSGFKIITTGSSVVGNTDLLTLNISKLDNPANTYSIKYQIQVPTETSSDNSNNTIPIAVGAGAGGLILIIIVIILIVKRKHRRPKPPPPPDFAPYIYGSLLEISLSDQKKQIEKIKDLKPLLVSEQLTLVKAIFNITNPSESDSVCRALVYLFERDSLLMKLLKKRIKDEIRETQEEGTLFRSNSLASKMMKTYSQLVGLPYLYDTLVIEIFDICKSLFQHDVEVDPNRIEEDQESDVDINRWFLLASAQQIFSRIIKSGNETPDPFKFICFYLRKHVVKKYPDSKYTAIGGFIFLRVFCPAITTPEIFGLVKEQPSDSARRHLVLVAKSLQNVANGTNFKEGTMEELSVFVKSNTPKAYKFFDEIADRGEKVDNISNIEIPDHICDVSLAVLHRFIVQNREKLINELNKTEEGKEISKRLEAMLDQIGEPIPKKVTHI